MCSEHKEGKVFPITYMLLQNLNYMMFHFGKACALSFLENSGQSELVFIRPFAQKEFSTIQAGFCV